MVIVADFVQKSIALSGNDGETLRYIIANQDTILVVLTFIAFIVVIGLFISVAKGETK